MRVGELNAMFKVSGFGDVCTHISAKDDLMHHFGETNAGKVFGLFLDANEEFFERRNAIAHSLNAASSAAPDQVRTDIAYFRATAFSLATLLDEKTKVPATKDAMI